ncbi:MAG: cyclic nucleotide-binding domain-containing protein [Anaerolineae bacterium]|jgi:signal transduction histidine kinase|nr:cyclic nucleotide-binding domain-containing protein [Anaerolineae bacterium]MBT4309324.1 cyclic nucleotide-binding domain-containing protein [Anaerolineae bacterium]MBT4458191.1 cyclic nucleotide-binding domain-containing protein [Anaerolineae bacterium]MBT4842315.1 cyclic nucleotide-binding domain-containing protein [Anaerolineae bacterium]MBT6062625.1 cyclic nucleotide-binding domain-containing protein [Anaerolineae bacterium]
MTTRRAPSRIIPRAFPGITASETTELITNSQVHAYAPGTALCQENALEDTFYIILEGEAEVTKVINRTEVRLLKTLRSGDFFGEMALIHNVPRGATVTARTHLVALELNKESFDRVLKNSSTMAMTMVREISSRLRTNDEMAVEDLRLRASELAQAYQKLAEQELTRREFLTNIAHELRTPLMAAGGFLQALQKGMIPKKNVKDTVDTVARNVQRITTLVNDILFLQEMDLVLPDFHPVNLEELAKKVIKKYLQNAKEHDVKLHLNANRRLPSVSGDVESLEHALEGLVDNAIKFSPKGGDVDIRIRSQGGLVSLSVQDRGIGISEERLPRIFDRFHHVEEKDGNLFGGIGIGLAIAQQVITQHEGKLDVQSKEGEGSIFTMSLKRVQD